MSRRDKFFAFVAAAWFAVVVYLGSAGKDEPPSTPEPNPSPLSPMPVPPSPAPKLPCPGPKP